MDNDIGINVEFIYGIQFLIKNNVGKFIINFKIGVIFIREVWKGGDYIEFEVNVIDGGFLQRFVLVYVSLDCEVKNYLIINLLEFDKKSYKEFFEEDIDVGKIVVVVLVFDFDYDILIYFISSGNVGNKF